MFTLPRHTHVASIHRIAFVLSILFIAPACNSLSYYGQAIGGHLSLMAGSEPLDEVMNDPDTSDELRQGLELAQSIVAFAEQEMLLPGNGSYRHYVKVQGRYVVWNVVATPPYSIQARQWCYPFAGCVTYRGYFAEADARQFAQTLQSQGMDIAVAGASAYSTLGWLDDPLFSSMMYRDEARLVEVIIHELAHQRLYIPGDTVFNEGFASVVAREGVRRWFEKKKTPQEFKTFIQSQHMDKALNRLLMVTRERLEVLYTSDSSDEEKAAGKIRIFSWLQDEYVGLKSAGVLDGRFDSWMQGALNNANLALVAAYHQLEPELELLLRQQDGDLERFYWLAEHYRDGEKPVVDGQLLENQMTK